MDKDFIEEAAPSNKVSKPRTKISKVPKVKAPSGATVSKRKNTTKVVSKIKKNRSNASRPASRNSTRSFDVTEELLNPIDGEHQNFSERSTNDQLVDIDVNRLPQNYDSQMQVVDYLENLTPKMKKRSTKKSETNVTSAEPITVAPKPGEITLKGNNETLLNVQDLEAKNQKPATKKRGRPSKESTTSKKSLKKTTSTAVKKLEKTTLNVQDSEMENTMNTIQKQKSPSAGKSIKKKISKSSNLKQGMTPTPEASGQNAKQSAENVSQVKDTEVKTEKGPNNLKNQNVNQQESKPLSGKRIRSASILKSPRRSKSSNLSPSSILKPTVADGKKLKKAESESKEADGKKLKRAESVNKTVKRLNSSTDKKIISKNKSPIGNSRSNSPKVKKLKRAESVNKSAKKSSSSHIKRSSADKNSKMAIKKSPAIKKKKASKPALKSATKKRKISDTKSKKTVKTVKAQSKTPKKKGPTIKKTKINSKKTTKNVSKGKQKLKKAPSKRAPSKRATK